MSGGRRGARRAGRSVLRRFHTMMRRQERRSDLERRRRVDELLARVIAAPEAIVETGLDAVHDSRAADADGQFARPTETGAPSASRRVRSDG
jgi:hypothetical protein